MPNDPTDPTDPAVPPHEPGEGEADAKAVLGSLFGNISDSDDDTLGLAPAVRKVAAPPPQATIGEVTLAPVSPRVGAFTAKLPDAPAAGTYDVLQEIARGGMGAVIAVRDRRLGRTVAMKVIREMAADDDGTRARFIREARITGQLEHPNIVPVHELGRDAQQHDYFTMKLVQGQSLSAALAALRDDVAAGRGDAAFPLRSRLDVFGKICDAIAYANARGVIHRDLKPDNVMVGQFGEVQVMDWGLARLREDADTSRHGAIAQDAAGPVITTRAGEVLGTPAYMSPEQARGQLDRIDARTDVYGLGAILYQLITLAPPIAPGTVYAVLDRVVRGEIVAPRARVERDDALRGHLKVPAELEAVALKALSVEQSARYASVELLRADVNRFLDGRFVEAARYTTAQRAVRWIARNRLGVVVAVLLVALAGVGWWVAGQARAAEMQRNLDPFGKQLQAAAASLDAMRAQIADGKFAIAISTGDAFAHQHAPALASLSANALVVRHHPEWVQQAAALPPAVRELQRAALAQWSQSAMRELPADVAAPAGADLERAEQWFTRFRDESARLQATGVEVAAYAYWLARVYSHRADVNERAALDAGQRPDMMDPARGEMTAWIAQAWMAAPDSRYAGLGMLLLSERGLARVDSITALERLVLQFQLALTAFAHSAPELQPRALVGMSKALLQLPPDQPSPCDPQVTAHLMALGCLLHLVTPDGRVTAKADEWLGDRLPPDERNAVLRDANDLLMIARRTAIGDRLDGGVQRSEGGSLIVVQGNTATIGARRINLRQREPRLIDAGCDGTNTVALLHADGLVVIHDITQPGRSGAVPVSATFATRGIARIADLDGDLLGDLLLVDNGAVSMRLQQPDGSFSAPTAIARGAAGRVNDVQAADLDADGICEIIIARGEPHYAVEVWQLDERKRPEFMLDTFTGDVALTLVPGERRHRMLVLAPVSSPAARLNFRVAGTPLESRLVLLQLELAHLHDIPLPWEQWPDTGYPPGARVSPLLGLDGGTQALITPVRTGHGWLTQRWMITEGSLLTPLRPRWHDISVSCRPLGDDTYLCGDRITHRLRDDQFAIDERATRLPLATRTDFALAPLLLWCGESDATARLIGNSPSDPAQSLLLVRALAASHRIDELLPLAARMAADVARFEPLLVAIDAIAHEAGRVEDALALLAPLDGNPQLSPDQAARVQTRLAAMRATIDGLARAHVGWEVEHWITNDPTAARRDGDAWLLPGSGGANADTFAGVPVQIGNGGPLRLRATFTVPLLAADTGFRLGLFAPGSDTPSPGIDVQCRGEANVFGARLDGLPLEMLVGRELQVQIDRLPAFGIERLTVRDAASQAVLHYRVRALGSSAPVPSSALLGWRLSRAPTRSFLRVHALELSGAVAFAPSSDEPTPATRAARLLLADRGLEAAILLRQLDRPIDAALAGARGDDTRVARDIDALLANRTLSIADVAAWLSRQATPLPAGHAGVLDALARHAAGDDTTDAWLRHLLAPPRDSAQPGIAWLAARGTPAAAHLLPQLLATEPGADESSRATWLLAACDANHLAAIHDLHPQQIDIANVGKLADIPHLLPLRIEMHRAQLQDLATAGMQAHKLLGSQ